MINIIANKAFPMPGRSAGIGAAGLAITHATIQPTVGDYVAESDRI